ncbi:hypothetical protein LCGC14_2426610 [marine sediment metagenome]|uniref:Restriction alleviation protein, Lar family n=1 Tax=marine sediment metagenome TaxID=412755 RepID=A0A0F9E080_9ZZZZ
MKESKLKNCPFCGGEAKCHTRTKFPEGFTHIECENKCLEKCDSSYYSKEEAIKAWNVRKGEK